MITIKLKGEREIRALINNLEAATSLSMAKAIAMSAYRVENTARELAPEDTGRMANSIQTDMRQTENGIVARVGPTDNVIYAKYVEYGTGIYAVSGNGRRTPWVYFNERWKRFVWTVGNKAQPFLFPALKRHKTYIRDIFRAAVREGWGKVTKK